jgi:LCP family protein required for cell wall assembly
MSRNVSSFWQRLPRLLMLRVLPAVLAAGALLVAVQLGANLSARAAAEAGYRALAPAYAATATAYALTPEAAGAASAPEYFKREHERMQVFATNTPHAPTPEAAQPASATAAAPAPQAAPAEPVLPAGTPRPLPTLFIYSGPDGSSAAPTAIPTPVEALDRQGNDLMNIVLLGNDNEITGESVARTDTIMILSINRTANSVSLLSLPRDLYVFVPSWTMQRINVAYPYGESVGWTDGGFGLLRQTLFYNLGINVHYYAMVDLTGFKALVDAVGGVQLTVDCAIEDLPLIGAELPAAAVRVNEEGYRVLPVGSYQMTGAEALWYARSRHNSSDFDRGRRQQQVVRAVWRAARDGGLLTNLPALWTEGSPYVETNLTFEDILGLLPLAAGLDPSRIETFTLVRTYHTQPWQTPDGDYVQLPVYETMRPLLQDFYTPPTESQVAAEVPTVAVYNGTANTLWDAVAADRLAWEGFAAQTLGPAADGTAYPHTVLVDYTGRTKGSSLEAIATALNVRPENIRLDPRPDRTVDFEVIIGDDYNSCSTQGVLPTTTLPVTTLPAAAPPAEATPNGG